MHEVGQRVADAASQEPDLGREGREPLTGNRVIAEVAGVIECVEQRHDVGWVDPSDSGVELVVDIALDPSVPTRQTSRTVSEQGEVAQPDAPARPGKQAYE